MPGTQEAIKDTIACRRKGLAVPVPTRVAVWAQGCPRALGLHVLPSFSSNLTSKPQQAATTSLQAALNLPPAAEVLLRANANAADPWWA